MAFGYCLKTCLTKPAARLCSPFRKWETGGDADMHVLSWPAGMAGTADTGGAADSIIAGGTAETTDCEETDDNVDTDDRAEKSARAFCEHKN